MATIYDLKPRFQSLLRPLVGVLALAGVSANAVTLAAAMLSIAYGAWLYGSGLAAVALWGLPIFLFIRMGLNAIDGMLAREHHQQSKIGAIFNELGDVISDVGLYLPFALLVGVWAPLVVMVVILGVMVEFVGVVAVQIGATRRYDGPFGKSDRAVFFGIFAWVAASGIGLDPWGNWIMGAAIVASALTIFNRAKAALAEAGDTENTDGETKQ